jgi:hypothetical protein
MSSFSPRSNNTPEGNEDATLKPNMNGNLWETYVKNMDVVMRELGATYNYNQALMDNVRARWKEFTDSISNYTTAGKELGSMYSSTDDIWTKWFEYANSMNSQLLHSYYALYQSQPDMQSQDYYSSSGERINPGPAYNDMNKLNRQSMEEMNEVLKKYYAEISKEFMTASEAVLSQKTSAVESSQEFMEKWSDTYNNFLKELISTPAFNVISHENMKQMFNTKKQMDEAIEQHWKMLGLPTRTDIMELHRELHDLQIKLNRLNKQLVDNGINKKPKKKR